MSNSWTYCRWNHYCVLHSVEDFFVRRANRRKSATEFGFAINDEIVRAKTHAALHHLDLVRRRIQVWLLNDASLMEVLQNVRMVGETLEGVMYGLLPFLLRD